MGAEVEVAQGDGKEEQRERVGHGVGEQLAEPLLKDVDRNNHRQECCDRKAQVLPERVEPKPQVLPGRSPQRLQVGLYHEFDSGRYVTVDGLWVDFSEFGTGDITVENNAVVAPEGIYDDIWGITLGLGFPQDDRTTWKVGLMYVSEAVDDGIKEAQEIVEGLKGLVKLFAIPRVSNWVAISSTEQPEIMTDVMVKYKDGIKEVAFFDGDKRFYIEKDDRDVTETIIEWHKLP